MDWGNALELIRPWMTTGFIAGILGIAVKLYVDNRRLKLAEKARDQDFQLEISADGRTNLQFVIDNLVRDITAQREAHERCEGELQRMREAGRERDENYRKQSKKLDGIERQFIAYQLEVGRAIPPEHRTPVLDSLLKQHDRLARGGRSG
jgi:hypothetical protein